MAGTYDLPEWKPPPIYPVLGDRQVHIWLLSLRSGQSPQDRRSLLTQYLHPYLLEQGDSETRTTLENIALEPITLEQNDYGKPYLPQFPLEFNWSHSGNLALLAVTHLAPLGIDLEILRPSRYRRAIAQRFFSPEEQSYLERAPLAQADQRFLSLWTRYEAEMKARGRGIFAPPTHGENPAENDTKTQEESYIHYIHTFQPLPQTIASVVVLTQHIPQLVFFDARQDEHSK
ncbi:4'-phosphopantetheinyl transferase superfamily protein [Candidatus Synechococcus calcipolaris G9]|uniref:4'-phosphopantetheinyl transferase superfamily protein n=1 Tax=Candidatus Synechococcus calcipolaris G9 TaxID=1497997 RepID=A0ABT6EW80_9SYNE|nr:4'-phosphopantetheinyl transferase superfamily protein [Candidatus Synechococcus calcipolaris]MDG2990040.1 4'-phosphopantetheinyl transferase superfamily protein [Candidatus Synechococcus calcipolaris G9]